MTYSRRTQSRKVRIDAAETAYARHHDDHVANGDEQRFASANYMMSFSKGLRHCDTTGLVAEKGDFEAFRFCIDDGEIVPFTTRVPVPDPTAEGFKKRRMWEAPTAGLVHDLQGPDAQAVTMPPAPALGSDELDFEMAEVYELALLRDVPFNLFDGGAGGDAAQKAKIQESVDRLNKLAYAKDKFPGRPRKNEDGKLKIKNVFRGSSPGVDVGPYVSQFMLIGNGQKATTPPADQGFIAYGPQRIDQRVQAAKEGDDYMQTFDAWRKVQNGYEVRPDGDPGQDFGQNDSPPSVTRRFIYTPRDLATYVHTDALYQAYLNACLIMLSGGTPFDPAFDELSGPGGKQLMTAGTTMLNYNAGGFALYGGPHILTLVTEVATRALKAVRYQKFNNHLRLRPEALAGRLACASDIEHKHKGACSFLTEMCGRLEHTLKAVDQFNKDGGHYKKNAKKDANYFLPMAFAEGSPMHPTYGAGHATVAGACVTILKAFFDTGAIFGANDKGDVGFFDGSKVVTPLEFEAMDNGSKLVCKETKCPLTLEGELNKLAANISIGRNMAGVHYFSDYFDSLRMGEKIAIGMLEEQALCYPTDPFVMSVPTFDGGLVRIGNR